MEETGDTRKSGNLGQGGSPGGDSDVGGRSRLPDGKIGGTASQNQDPLKLVRLVRLGGLSGAKIHKADVGPDGVKGLSRNLITGGSARRVANSEGTRVVSISGRTLKEIGSKSVEDIACKTVSEGLPNSADGGGGIVDEGAENWEHIGRGVVAVRERC